MRGIFLSGKNATEDQVNAVCPQCDGECGKENDLLFPRCPCRSAVEVIGKPCLRTMDFARDVFRQPFPLLPVVLLIFFPEHTLLCFIPVFQRFPTAYDESMRIVIRPCDIVERSRGGECPDKRSA